MAPTVTLWPNFKEEEDAQILRDSLDGLGTNENAIIEILTKRTNEQRRRIVTAYKTMFGEDLVNDLKIDLGGDFEHVILALLKDPLEYQTEELHKAIRGMGTDDPTLVEILVIHDDDELKQLAEKYQEVYNISLEDAIKGDETGALQQLLVSLSTGGRNESGQVDKDAALADAQKLYDAGEASWGTRESIFNTILCIRNRNQLRLIIDKYDSMIGHPIEEAIENEFSGSTKDAYLSLIRSIRDRTMYLATRLHDAMAGLGTDDRTLIRIIVSRSEIDLAEIKEAYEAKYSKSLYERISPTVTLWPNFKEDEDAQILRDSLDGLGTNEDAVIEILTRRTNEQRRRIVTAYKTMFGEDLVEDLKGDLGGDFEDVILALLKDPLEYQTEELHKAISGMGTDDPTLVEILVIHDDDEIKQITEKYQEMYDTSLEDAIKGDETGTLQRLLVSLSTGGRDESSQVDRDGAIADAQNLYDAGESSWGTEESVFNSILCIRNRNQLRLIFDEYETMIGHSIEDAIENEFSGSTKDAYLSLVMSIRDRPMYLATRLHDAMAGMGTDDRTLIRIIVSRSEIDLAEIKEAYEAKYSKSLYERVSGDCSGKYEKTLLKLIG
ncbi:unnamed protein product [Psylliodes chrysocephalus]|uniref:Annexin n=1 Tax=Psylliodes chrysocephalus TaxID=3402493 RepID=A0A9P0CGE6_9CUCU|nr:unnamed protein product [Psylliodes chrysocephala]